MQSKITAVVLGGVCVWLALIVVAAQVRYMSNQRKIEAVTDRIESSEKENTRLAGELERMKQPSWLALLARARLNVKKPDETVVFVYKSEKVDTIGQPEEVVTERSNWKKWLDWVELRIKN